MVDVACFGEVLWDWYELPKRTHGSTTFVRMIGGALANVAVGLARLGVRSSVVGGVGRDRFGDELVDTLTRERVDMSHAVRLPNRTGLAFISRDKKGQPTFLFYRHESADVSVEDVHIEPSMANAKWVAFGSSTLQARGLRKATHRFLAAAATNNAHVFFDLNIRAHLWKDASDMKRRVEAALPGAHVIKASWDDLRAWGDPEKALKRVRKAAPGGVVLITRGDGVATATGAFGQIDLPARRARCVDATGAGDAFIAGVLATLVRNRAMTKSSLWSDAGFWRHALDIGHRMGQKAVTMPGAVTGLLRLENIQSKLQKNAHG